MKVPVFIIVILVLFVSPRIGGYLADLLSPSLVFIDPDRTFVWGMVHHVGQALLPLLIMLLWKSKTWKDWGFQPGYRARGIRWVAGFSLVWFGVYLLLTVYHIVNSHVPEVYYDVQNVRNLTGELLFRGLLVGPSEEVLFRSFPIVVLLFAGFSRKIDIFGFEISQAGIIAAVLFSLAHIGFNLYPFEVYHFDLLQLFTSLGFGLLYAIVFRHTKSIYYPMAIHAISDVMPVLSLYAVYWFD